MRRVDSKPSRRRAEAGRWEAGRALGRPLLSVLVPRLGGRPGRGGCGVQACRGLGAAGSPALCALTACRDTEGRARTDWTLGAHAVALGGSLPTRRPRLLTKGTLETCDKGISHTQREAGRWVVAVTEQGLMGNPEAPRQSPAGRRRSSKYGLILF